LGNGLALINGERVVVVCGVPHALVHKQVPPYLKHGFQYLRVNNISGLEIDLNHRLSVNQKRILIARGPETPLKNHEQQAHTN
jgi:hypothetical protein